MAYEWCLVFISSQAFSGTVLSVKQQLSLSCLFSVSMYTHRHTHTKEPKLISGMPRCHWMCWKVASTQGWYHECYYIWMLPSLEKFSNLVIQEWELSHFSQLVIKTPYIHSRLINQHLLKNKDWRFSIWLSGAWESLTMLVSRTEKFCQKALRMERCKQE